MKHLTILLMSCLLFFFAGCGDDDGGGPTPTPATRVVAAHPASAPSLDSVDDPVWDAINATTVDLDQSSFYKMAVGKTMAVPASLSMKALVYNDSLYLRVTWVDADHDVWRDRYDVLQTSPSVVISHDATGDDGAYAEDQLLVMFAGLDDDGYDVWNWRALTTAAGLMAEGMTLDTLNGLVSDDSNQPGYFVNAPIAGSSVPSYVHQDGSAFTGYILYTTEDLDVLGSAYNDWVVDQIVPGWRIDSAVVHYASAVRGSRWDIRAASEYDDGANQYTVMMCRPMNTGFAEDLNLATVDSVEVVVGVTDNQISIETEGSNLGFSESFWMIF